MATTLKRKINRLTAKLRSRMEETGVLESYKARPPYQRNDYLSWIKNARQEATREKRTRQMISELKKGNVYMNMRWSNES